VTQFKDLTPEQIKLYDLDYLPFRWVEGKPKLMFNP
jgi:hypothetical protein